jgi:hypothetical protein
MLRRSFLKLTLAALVAPFTRLFGKTMSLPVDATEQIAYCPEGYTFYCTYEDSDGCWYVFKRPAPSVRKLIVFYFGKNDHMGHFFGYYRVRTGGDVQMMHTHEVNRVIDKPARKTIRPVPGQFIIAEKLPVGFEVELKDTDPHGQVILPEAPLCVALPDESGCTLDSFREFVNFTTPEIRKIVRKES